MDARAQADTDVWVNGWIALTRRLRGRLALRAFRRRCRSLTA